MAGSRIKRHARPAAQTERAHGSAERREWTKTRPCAICGRTPSDAAHVRSGGTGRKDDVERTVPLCSDDIPSGYIGHHSEYDGRKHAGGKRTFEAKYGVDMLALADENERAWQSRIA